MSRGEFDVISSLLPFDFVCESSARRVTNTHPSIFLSSVNRSATGQLISSVIAVDNKDIWLETVILLPLVVFQVVLEVQEVLQEVFHPEQEQEEVEENSILNTLL